VSILIGVGAILIHQGVAIPDYVWAILSAVGLGAVRAAIEKLKK